MSFCHYGGMAPICKQYKMNRNQTLFLLHNHIPVPRLKLISSTPNPQTSKCPEVRIIYPPNDVLILCVGSIGTKRASEDEPADSPSRVTKVSKTVQHIGLVKEKGAAKNGSQKPKIPVKVSNSKLHKCN